MAINIIDKFLKNIISDISVDLTDEFMANFDRKSFFGSAWKPAKLQNRMGSLLMRTGALRNSINQPSETADSITWTSSLPYAALQNYGGQIVVSQKMKSFFWAMYYKSSNAAGTKVSPRQQRLSQEAQQWKALALQPVGKIMKVEQRQFIGDHPAVRSRINTIITTNFKEIEKDITKSLKK